MKKQLPNILDHNILAEPIAKNMAICIGLASAVILKKCEDAVALVLSSDHLIKYNEVYIDKLYVIIQVSLLIRGMSDEFR